MNQRSALIIDDEPDVATYLGTVLTDNGWRVRTANKADDGLELAREDVPDIILLDLMMPGRGGMSTLVAIRKDPRLHSVPVVFVTGIQDQLNRDFEAYLGRFHSFRPDALLEKPVEAGRLIEVVDELTAAVAL